MPHVRSILIIIGIACYTLSTFSQPELKIESVTVNWPTIYVDFHQYCNGEPSYHGEKGDFSVFEDGRPVKDFTLYMPKPHVRSAFSVSLVFDASASMQGDHRDWTKSAAHNFIDNMDGVADEAAIVWFHSSTHVELSLTSNKMSLNSAIDALPAAGATAMWNGAYEGIQQIISGASNNVRAVIVLSDGADNSSIRTVQELVALANQHRVKVYTIGLGTGADLPSLDALASNTGGVFFHCTTVSELHSAYMDIFDRLISADLSTITYQSHCTDGRNRIIEVMHNDLCGGDAYSARTYRAPFDTTGFSFIEIGVPGDTLPPGTSTTLPVTAMSTGAPIETGLIFEIRYNKEIANIYGVQLDGTLLENVSPDIQLEPGLISVTIDDYLWIQGLDTLLKLRVQAGLSPPSPGETTISFDETYSSNCIITSYTEGLFVVNNLSAPGIVVHGTTEFCEGDSVTLEVSDGFTDYRWSTGDTAKSITVFSSQNVWVEARNSSGQLRVSSSVPVTVYPIPHVSIAQPDTVNVCDGDTITLSAEGDFPEYLWSTGEGSKNIRVEESGVYYLQARSENGCWGESSAVHVVLNPIPVPSIAVTGDMTICAGDTTILDAGTGYDEYAWSSGEQTQQIGVSNSGEYWVAVRRAGCEGISDTVVITAYPKPEQPQIVRKGDTLQCTADGVAFQWFIDGTEIPGEISKTVVIQDHGRYAVRVIDVNGCTALSDPVVVTSVHRIPDARTFNVSISPNPGTGTFFLQVQSESLQTYSVVIHDASGKTVHSMQLSNSRVLHTATIELGDLPEGVYFMAVSSPTAQQTKKLMVLRK